MEGEGTNIQRVWNATKTAFIYDQRTRQEMGVHGERRRIRMDGQAASRVSLSKFPSHLLVFARNQTRRRLAPKDKDR
jgi:hypothetical protein